MCNLVSEIDAVRKVSKESRRLGNTVSLLLDVKEERAEVEVLHPVIALQLLEHGSIILVHEGAKLDPGGPKQG